MDLGQVEVYSYLLTSRVVATANCEKTCPRLSWKQQWHVAPKNVSSPEGNNALNAYGVRIYNFNDITVCILKATYIYSISRLL